MGKKRDPKKNRTADTIPTIIDNEAHMIVVRESSKRKLSRKWSSEEYSIKFLISEAIKQIYGSDK